MNYGRLGAGEGLKPVSASPATPSTTAIMSVWQPC